MAATRALVLPPPTNPTVAQSEGERAPNCGPLAITDPFHFHFSLPQALSICTQLGASDGFHTYGMCKGSLNVLLTQEQLYVNLDSSHEPYALSTQALLNQ